jgi:hypothetical protein
MLFILLGFISIVIYSIGLVNVIVSIGGISGLIQIGRDTDFEMGVIIGIIVCTFLFFCETIKLLLYKKLLQSIIPNIFFFILSVMWISFSGLMLYGLFEDEKLLTFEHRTLMFVFAIWLTVVNTCTLIYYGALCFRKVRHGVLEVLNHLEKTKAERQQ